MFRFYVILFRYFVGDWVALTFKLFGLSPAMCVFLVACGGGGSPDLDAPVITITGSETINHEQGTTYTDEGATATDAWVADILT